MVLQNFFYDVLFADFSLYHSPRKLVWFEQLPLYTPFHEKWNFFAPPSDLKGVEERGKDLSNLDLWKICYLKLGTGDFLGLLISDFCWYQYKYRKQLILWAWRPETYYWFKSTSILCKNFDYILLLASWDP